MRRDAVNGVLADRILRRIDELRLIDDRDGSEWELSTPVRDVLVAGYSESANGAVICVCDGVYDDEGSVHVQVARRVT